MDSYTLPSDLRYTASHLWVRKESGQAVIGLTEHGAELFGKILYVGLPAVGTPVPFGLPVGYLQSAGFGLTQLFPPVRGTVSAINDELWRKPQLLNEAPLGAGWILAIDMTDAAEFDELETAQEYREILQGERRVRGSELPSHLRESAVPAFLIDERRRVLDCNGAAESLIGLSRDEMKHGPLCAEVFGCHYEPDQPIAKHDCPGLCSMLNLEPIHNAEYTVTNAQGSETKVLADYTPHDFPGQPRRAVVVMRPLD